MARVNILPRMSFSSIQQAIQEAFDTYWKVREGREQRGENEKNRQSAMAMAQLGQTGEMARGSASDRAAAERIRLQGEEERRTRREFPGQFGPSNVNFNAERAAEREKEQKAREYQMDRLKRKVETLTTDILGKIDDDKWNWKKIKDTYSTFFGEELETWQWKKLQTDPLLAQDFVKKNVARAVLRAYTNNEYREEFGEAILFGQDLDNLFSPWINREVSWGEQPPQEEKIPLYKKPTPPVRPYTGPTGTPLPTQKGAGMEWTLPQGGGMPVPKLR